MNNIKIIKFNGASQDYSEEKVLTSILKAGVAKEAVMPILERIRKQVVNNMTTRQLYDIVWQEIEKEGLAYNSRLYRLREALGKMQSINYEKFVATVLEKKGWNCSWNTLVPGFCVTHQVDIIAKKDGKLLYVEVKHHRNPHRESGLGLVAEIWGRLEDMQSGYKAGKSNFNFDHAWLFTNTKFSAHAKKYSLCKEIWLTGWRYSWQDVQGDGFEDIINTIGENETDELIRSFCFS